MENLIPILIFTVALATSVNLLARRFNMPTVIGYILTGAIVGALFNIDLHHNQTLENIAEFGVVFLMFTIGLEFSLAHLIKMKREVFAFGLLQVVLTTAIMTLASQLLTGIELKTGIIVGAGLALSSTAIVLKVLNETGKIKSAVGRQARGILIFQDMAVIPILLMISIFSEQGKSLSELLISTLTNAAIVLLLLIGIGKYLFRYVFQVVSNANSKEIYMGTILLTVVGASYVAHHFGFSYSLGSFIAGMMIAETIYKYQVEADLIPFRDLLLGVFFVTVGMQIDINIVLVNIRNVVLLGIGIMAIKAASIFAILIGASDKRTAFKSALCLAQVGEFALVVFSLLLANQMLDATSVQVLMVVTIVSMLTTPLLIHNADRIAGRLFREKIEDKALDEASIIGGHVILCGYGEFGRVVSEQLDHSAITHVVVTNNTEAFVKASEAGKTVVFGDPSDRTLLEHLKIRGAMSVILALEDFDEIKKVSANISLIDPEIKVIAKVLTEQEMQELAEFNHELLLDGNSYTASLLVGQINQSRLLAKETLQLQFLGDYSLDNPDAAIDKVSREQARLLNVMAKSFNALREDLDIMQVKAFHDSFKGLSQIVRHAITDIMSNAALTPGQYGRISILLDNQEHLMTMNDALEHLGKELKLLKKHDKTSSLLHIAVEGLDAILLLLIELAVHYDEDDMMMLKKMTSWSGAGEADIHGYYLKAENGDLDATTKATVLSSANRIVRLRSLFGIVANNYKRLAQA